jgi:hypothetical protein
MPAARAWPSGISAAIVDQTNALAPDLVVLLGDYIASHQFVTERVPPDVSAGEFARLVAPLGVWVEPRFVTSSCCCKRRQAALGPSLG